VRVLIVKLSSLGDVVHTMPVVHDIRTAHPDALVDWVVEPGFAPLVRRVQGIHSSIECALRRWRKRWWTGAVRAEWHLFREAIGGERYDAVIDFQGLTKSALVARLARGPRYGLANRTEGASHEWPARWLVDHPIEVDTHIHALDRARVLAARALGYGGAFNGFNQMVDAELRELLGVPDGTAIAGTITLGKPAGHHGPVRRRPMAELVYEDGWGSAPAWAVDPPGTEFTSAGPPK
jgi:lipopolysaccharide heptosyltransferase I